MFTKGEKSGNIRTLRFLVRAGIIESSVAGVMTKHHLLLGHVRDYLTGNVVEDTHDERYRQKIARILVEEKGYLKSDIEAGRVIRAGAGAYQGTVTADYVIRLEGSVRLLVKYGPGSIVTRRRGALAASRLVGDHQVPVVVVTNGEDADILDGFTGKRLAKGLGGIPGRRELPELDGFNKVKKIGPDAAEREARILYALEVEGSCGCEGSV